MSVAKISLVNLYSAIPVVFEQLNGYNFINFITLANGSNFLYSSKRTPKTNIISYFG